MRQIKYSLLLFSIYTLSSCGIYSTYKPSDTAPENLYGEVNADTSTVANIAWRDFFTDEYLQRLIQTGLDKNTNLLTAQLRVKESEASLLASKLAFLPSVGLAPQGSVSNTATNETYTLPATASWQIDLFGSLRNAKEGAKSSYQQLQAVEQAVRTQVVASIANCYYTLLMLDEQLSISLSTQEKWKQSVDVARALKQAGQYNEAGVAQTEATYYEVCNGVEDLRKEIVSVENALCLLLTETPHPIERGKLENQAFSNEMSVGIPVQLLQNRPDVRSSEYALSMSYYGVQQARSSFYPSLNLSGSLGWTNNAGIGVINPAVYIQSATASLTQPIFNRGQNIARLKIAKAQLEEAKLAFEHSLLNAGVEVNNALTTLQQATRKAELYQKEITALERAVNSTRLLMKNGSTNYLEVLTAERSLLSARLAQTSNVFLEIQSRINLYQALGGGRF